MNETLIQSLILYAVQKGKTKTPAQDRLQKIVKNDRIAKIAVTELLKNHTIDLQPTEKNMLPKNYLPYGSVNSLKSNVVVKFTNDVKPAQAVGIVDCKKPAEATKIKWSNDFARNENVSKIGPTTFDAKKSVTFYLPENGLQTCQSKLQSDVIKKGHDFQVHNRLKINEHSKIIGGKWLSFDLIFGIHTQKPSSSLILYRFLIEIY